MVSGRELWKTDGTLAGTVLVADVAPGIGNASPTDLAPIGTELYFAAGHGAAGRELWKSDGTAAGTVLVADVNAGASSSNPATHDRARDVGGVHGQRRPSRESSCGRPMARRGGTTQLADIMPGAHGSAPADLTPDAAGGLVFAADDGVAGRELWATDGTAAGTVLLTGHQPARRRHAATHGRSA